MKHRDQVHPFHGLVRPASSSMAAAIRSGSSTFSMRRPRRARFASIEREQASTRSARRRRPSRARSRCWTSSSGAQSVKERDRRRLVVGLQEPVDVPWMLEGVLEHHEVVSGPEVVRRDRGTVDVPGSLVDGAGDPGDDEAPGGPFRITTRCPDSLTVLTLRLQSPMASSQPLPSPARLTATWAMPKHAESRPWAGP